MRCFVRYLLLAVTLLITCFIPFNFASGHDSEEDQPPAATAAENSAELKDLADQAASAGHNAWMMTSCALVLFMTAPGLALFYCGLVRRKNVLSVMMQCIFLMGLMTIVWCLWGYSLCFGGTLDPDDQVGYSKWIGNGQFLFMNDVQSTWNETTGAAEFPVEGKIPRLTHMLFQGMFFIITPALICGAFAERIKFSTMVVFMLLWNTLVYCPLCHWMWDGGLFAQWGGARFCRRSCRTHKFWSRSPGLRRGCR